MDPLTLGYLGYNALNAIYGNREATRKAKAANRIAATQARYSRQRERPGFTEIPDRVAPFLANLYNTLPEYALGKALGIGANWGGDEDTSTMDQSKGPQEGPSPQGAYYNPWDMNFEPIKAGPLPAGALPGSQSAMLSPYDQQDPYLAMRQRPQQEPVSTWDKMVAIGALGNPRFQNMFAH